MKKVLVCLLVIAMLISLSACGDKEIKTETYDFGGITIDMPEGMEKEDVEGYYASAVADDYAVFIVKDDFYLLEEYGYDVDEMSIVDYADLVILANTQMTDGFTDMGNGKFVTEYISDVDGDYFYYKALTVKGSDAFWVLSFTCFADDKGSYEGMFDEWIDSVKVD